MKPITKELHIILSPEEYNKIQRDADNIGFRIETYAKKILIHSTPKK